MAGMQPEALTATKGCACWGVSVEYVGSSGDVKYIKIILILAL